MSEEKTTPARDKCPPLPDSVQVTLCRAPDSGHSAFLDHHAPKRPVNSVVLVRLHGVNDAFDGCPRKGDVVRVAVHKADVLPVGNDLDDVAGQQSAFAVSPALPMKDSATVEVKVVHLLACDFGVLPLVFADVAGSGRLIALSILHSAGRADEVGHGCSWSLVRQRGPCSRPSRG